jgi:hypothetical protein
VLGGCDVCWWVGEWGGGRMCSLIVTPRRQGQEGSLWTHDVAAASDDGNKLGL